MNGPLRRVFFVLLTAAILLALGVVVVAADTQTAASAPSKPISEQEAIADAMHQLANNGAGYTVVATQLEPSSSHFKFTGPNGQGFGEDEAKECLVIPPLPPLPFLTPCRYYPVWVVALSTQACDVVIAINAHTGRFGGAGSDYRGTPPANTIDFGNCGITPGGGGANLSWWQPGWE